MTNPAAEASCQKRTAKEETKTLFYFSCLLRNISSSHQVISSRTVSCDMTGKETERHTVAAALGG